MRSFLPYLAASMLGLTLLGGDSAEALAQAAAPAAPAAVTAAAPAGASLPAVRAGDRAVDGRRLRPGDRTLRLVLSMNDKEAGTATIHTVIAEAAAAGEPGWLVTKTIVTPRGTIYDSSLVRRRTLVPVWHHSTQPTRRMRLDFSPDSVTGAVTPNDSAPTPVHHRTEAPTFDSAVMDQVVAALPLAEGYAVRLPLYIYERGGLVWYDVRTAGTEEVAGRDGRPAAAWKVELRQPTMTATYWVAKSSHEVVRMAMDMGGGRRMTAQP